MNKFSRKLLALCVAMSCAVNSFAEPVVSFKFDRFSEQLRNEIPAQDVISQRMLIQKETVPVLVAVTKTTIDQSMTPVVFALRYMSSSNTWKYLGCRQSTILVDGKRLATFTVHHDGDVVRGGVIESPAIILSTEEMRQILTAQTVEYKLCQTEGIIPADERAAMLTAIQGAFYIAS